MPFIYNRRGSGASSSNATPGSFHPASTPARDEEADRLALALAQARRERDEAARAVSLLTTSFQAERAAMLNALARAQDSTAAALALPPSARRGSPLSHAHEEWHGDSVRQVPERQAADERAWLAAESPTHAPANALSSGTGPSPARAFTLLPHPTSTPISNAAPRATPLPQPESNDRSRRTPEARASGARSSGRRARSPSPSTMRVVGTASVGATTTTTSSSSMHSGVGSRRRGSVGSAVASSFAHASGPLMSVTRPVCEPLGQDAPARHSPAAVPKELRKSAAVTSSPSDAAFERSGSRLGDDASAHAPFAAAPSRESFQHSYGSASFRAHAAQASGLEYVDIAADRTSQAEHAQPRDAPTAWFAAPATRLHLTEQSSPPPQRRTDHSSAAAVTVDSPPASARLDGSHVLPQQRELHAGSDVNAAHAQAITLLASLTSEAKAQQSLIHLLLQRLALYEEVPPDLSALFPDHAQQQQAARAAAAAASPSPASSRQPTAAAAYTDAHVTALLQERNQLLQLVAQLRAAATRDAAHIVSALQQVAAAADGATHHAAA